MLPGVCLTVIKAGCWAFVEVCALLNILPVSVFRAVFKRIYGIKPPEMLTSKIFSTILAYFCSCSCQYCYYHINQNCCIFFSPKAFCDTQKLLKRRLRRGAPDPARELTTLPQTLIGWGGDTPPRYLPPRLLRRLDIGAFGVFAA